MRCDAGLPNPRWLLNRLLRAGSVLFCSERATTTTCLILHSTRPRSCLLSHPCLRRSRARSQLAQSQAEMLFVAR